MLPVNSMFDIAFCKYALHCIVAWVYDAYLGDCHVTVFCLLWAVPADVQSIQYGWVTQLSYVHTVKIRCCSCHVWWADALVCCFWYSGYCYNIWCDVVHLCTSVSLVTWSEFSFLSQGSCGAVTTLFKLCAYVTLKSGRCYVTIEPYFTSLSMWWFD